MIIIACIKLPRLNREACSNNFSREPGEGRQKSIDELLGTLQFSFTWDAFFLPSRGPGNRDWLLGNQFRDFPAARINWPSQDFPSGFFSTLSLEKGLPSLLSPKQPRSVLRLCGGREVGPFSSRICGGPRSPQKSGWASG